MKNIDKINKSYDYIIKSKQNDIINQGLDLQENKVFDNFGNYSFPTEPKINNRNNATSSLDHIIFGQS